jgi:dTDP-glucose 4,6-dehydratase
MINLLITGGCGFIGSNFINWIFKSNKYNIVNFDAMYYCASESNVDEFVRESPNYTLVKGNLCNGELVRYILETNKITQVIHFAAQSHVQNSFDDSIQFTHDNIVGTHTLLEECRKYKLIERFIHVSTDEVYGESMLEENESHKTEHSVLCPSNPYAATKAGAELIAQAYFHSYRMPIIITRGNNVYGPNQYPEKLVPRFIKLLKEGNKVTIQGDGSCVRAFLHAEDTARAFEVILDKGVLGEIYNIGCDEGMEYSVKEVAQILIRMIKKTENYNDWIEFIADRPFNDKRYYISNQKLKNLGWDIQINFLDGLEKLVNPNLKSVEVCFFHIEKCMGSSLRNTLYNYFKNIYDETKIFLPEKFNDKYNLVSNKDLDFLNNNFYKVILAHCNYNDQCTNTFSDKCFSITCVRNPFDRILSHYYYFDYINEKKLFHELSEERIKYYLNEYGHTMLFRLSGRTMNFDIAYNNISKMNCVLVFENIITELELMNDLLDNKFNKQIDIEIIKENETKFNYKIYKEKDIRIINRHLDLIPDIKIYDYVKNMSVGERFKI